MRKLLTLFSILLFPLMYINVYSQELPFVYDVENTKPDYPAPYFPSLSELPSIKSLPDPFMWADGRNRIKNFSDWEYRRVEIGAQIQNYEIGTKPTRPNDITASYTGGVLTVNITLNGKSLTLTSQVVLPTGTGPFPAVIGLGGFSGSGSIPDSIFSNRKVARITFMHNQVTTYGGPKTSDPYYQLYPDLNPTNTGQYSAWAWGVSRLIDGLELVQNVLPIDLKHLAVTGCSWAGKMALFAGAFDERIALTIAQESGGGGATSWRYSHSEPAGSVECVDNTDYNWFMDAMHQFAGDYVSRMPEDHHELMAMCAPRALLVTANPDYTWLSNPSCYVCSNACQQVYNTLGIPDRFGYSVVGGHSHCAVPSSQIPEIAAFVDKFLLGKNNVNTNVADTPYNVDLTNWINWTNPTLANGTSFLTTASLIYPANLQIDLEKTITFKWHRIGGVAKYYIQLASDAAFKNIIKSDSTNSDTVKTIAGLADAITYYWRIKVKNNSGELGPWSSIWKFTTYTPLPSAPKLVSAIPLNPKRADYVILTWRKALYAQKYLIQMATIQSFSSLLYADSVSTDTSKSIASLAEGVTYYWRVKSKNIKGTSDWIDSSFTIIIAPSDLAVQNSTANEVVLNWTDNSNVENGYVVERKQNSDTSFAIIDTLLKNTIQYIDTNVETGKTYTYRVKAYKGSASSNYSNQASVNLTAVKEMEMPKDYSLSQNYPNPFNPTTRIQFGLPKSGLTKIKIYDSLGREIQMILNKELDAGYHEVNVDGTNLPSGVYFYRIQSGDFVQTRKMVLMK